MPNRFLDPIEAFAVYRTATTLRFRERERLIEIGHDLDLVRHSLADRANGREIGFQGGAPESHLDRHKTACK